MKGVPMKRRDEYLRMKGGWLTAFSDAGEFDQAHNLFESLHCLCSRQTKELPTIRGAKLTLTAGLYSPHGGRSASCKAGPVHITKPNR